MIELRNDTLIFSFPEVHEAAMLEIDFQRTLRIPDDDSEYPLPPGLGSFPLKHVDDYAERIPKDWIKHGGVMLPMYQSEAMWLNFSTPYGYPFVVKVGTGKINAISGESWTDGIRRKPQDYLVVPEQPWLDGFCVEKGIIRQFVAMPLGADYSVEEQVTGEAEHGGLQICLYPIKAEAYRPPPIREEMVFCLSESAALDMGLAPGGRMRQEIYEDPYRFKDWDRRHKSRCFVHIANSLIWRSITGMNPPTAPPTSEEYTRAGLPWFEYYRAEAEALEGAGPFAALKSVVQMGIEKGDAPLPENVSVDPIHIVHLRKGLAKNQVREGEF